MANRKITLTTNPQSIDITDMGLRIKSDGSIFYWADSATKITDNQKDVGFDDRDVFINGPRKIWVWADSSRVVRVG